MPSGYRLSSEEFILRAQLKHGLRYDYSESVYTSSHSKLDIICNIHGKFSQDAGGHLRGFGCPECGRIQSGNSQKYSTIEFIEKAIKIHGNRYQYHNTDYKDRNTKLYVTCIKHGDWLADPGNFLQGAGCPNCNNSRGEQAIRMWLEENNVKFESQARFDKLKIKRHLRFDFYLREINVFIEFDGIQHFEPGNFSGMADTESLMRIQYSDRLKENFVKQENGILFRIRYNDDLNTKLDELNNLIKGIKC